MSMRRQIVDTMINWGEPDERKRLFSQLGEQQFEAAFTAYAETAAITTICGHKIVPLYDRTGEPESFYVMSTIHIFPTLQQAINYARSKPN
jgi:hypothetical protein